MNRRLEAEAREMDLRRQLNRARQDLEEQTNRVMRPAGTFRGSLAKPHGT